MSIFIKTEISNSALCEDASSAARGLVSRSSAQIRALARLMPFALEKQSN